METKTNKKSVNKSPIIFYVIMFLIPLIILSGLEIGLRIFNYGRDLDAFITLSKDYEEYLFVNPDIPFRYAANMQTPPAVAQDAFLKEKPDSTFRIFVMGGSTTAGFPYAYNATFPHYIKRKLEIVYPNVNFEVINLGITAHNSYTVADLASDVIKQKPDAVLVYAGHNEYYGILGVGSTIKFGGSLWVSKILISLNKFKTFQLLNNTIKYLTGIFNSQEAKTKSAETLMSRMIGENNIPFNSDMYYKGIEQFESNINDFLSEMSADKIPVILGTLTSNLRQKPFTSLIGQNNTKEDSLFKLGEKQFRENDTLNSQQSFLSAKEFDAIRFRAPEDMNKTLQVLADKYNYPLINIDSVFRKNSHKGIVGYDLMIDHLHPNIEGYNLMGEEFCKNIVSYKLLDKYKKTNLSNSSIDKLLKLKFPFTKLDSVIAKLRITALSNQYPFVAKETAKKHINNFIPINYIDSIAVKVMNKNISWREAHQLVAEWHYKYKRYTNFMIEMDAIIENQPYVEFSYAFTVSKLINANKFLDAEKYLIPLHKLNPNEYTFKWIGSFALNKGKYKKAIKNLIESTKINDTDPQVYYNLSGAYFNIGNINEAIKAVQKCLSINPQYPNAKQFYLSLKSLSKQNIK